MRGNFSDDHQRGRIEERFMTYEKEIDEAEEMTKKVFSRHVFSSLNSSFT